MSKGIKDFTRGGQTTLHTIRMVSQVVRWMLHIYLVSVIGIFAFSVFTETTSTQRHVLTQYYWIKVKSDFLEPAELVTFTNPSGFKSRVPAQLVLNNKDILRDKTQFEGVLLKATKFSGFLFLALSLMLIIFFRRKGKHLRSSKRLRGGSIATTKQLAKIVRKQGRSDYRLGGIPYPQNAETLHTFIAGGPGQGKTVEIKNLIEQIREKGDRAVIYDKMGVYVKEFFDPRTDTILNPLDKRCPNWNIFNEVRRPTDFDTIAAALIPKQKDIPDPFWVDAARTVFSSTALKLYLEENKNNSILLQTLLNTDIKKLGEVVKQTAANKLVTEGSDKTAICVLAVLSNYVKSLMFFQERADTQNSFSIRNWVDNGSGLLFVTSRGDQHETVRPLISMWIDTVVNQLLSLEQSRDRRFWVILDELPSLHKLPSLMSGLAESRQFGGSFVLSMQTLNQLRDIYGHDGAGAISGLCANRLVLGSPDKQTSDWVAQSLGSIELEEFREGLSYGASEIRDGVSLSESTAVRQLVLGSEIQTLDPLNGYLKFSGNYPVAKVLLKPKDRHETSKGFIPNMTDSEAFKALDAWMRRLPESVKEFDEIKLDSLKSQPELSAHTTW